MPLLRGNKVQKCTFLKATVQVSSFAPFFVRVREKHLTTQTCIVWKTLWHSLKRLLLCSAEERKSYRFGTTWRANKWWSFFAYTYSTFAWSPLSASPTVENQTHFVFLDIQIFTPTLIWVCALLLLLYCCNLMWNKSNCCSKSESLCNPVQQSDVEELIISFETIMQFPLWTRETSLTWYTSYIFFCYFKSLFKDQIAFILQVLHITDL